MRTLSSTPDEKPKWILLDGDLDAHWIESMNSVIDDNKMLTLASNERIPLQVHMRMIFKIRDLKHANPATVSRAGILYLSTDRGTQWRSIVCSWTNQLKCNSACSESLRDLFGKYVSESLRWLSLHSKQMVPIDDINRVQTLLTHA
jgi:dynein heavy chain, axonemal